MTEPLRRTSLAGTLLRASLRPTHRPLRRVAGFTIIELMIVIVLLGILAALVIPQFGNATDDASISNVAYQLRILRSQIELFEAQSGQPFAPTGPTGWDQLLANDYLMFPPANPLLDGASIVGLNYGPGVGWLWAQQPAGAPFDLHAVDSTGLGLVPD